MDKMLPIADFGMRSKVQNTERKQESYLLTYEIYNIEVLNELCTV